MLSCDARSVFENQRAECKQPTGCISCYNQQTPQAGSRYIIGDGNTPPRLRLMTWARAVSWILRGVLMCTLWGTTKRHVCARFWSRRSLNCKTFPVDALLPSPFLWGSQTVESTRQSNFNTVLTSGEAKPDILGDRKTLSSEMFYYLLGNRMTCFDCIFPHPSHGQLRGNGKILNECHQARPISRTQPQFVFFCLTAMNPTTRLPRAKMLFAISLFDVSHVFCRQVSGGLGPQRPHFGISGDDPFDLCCVRHLCAGGRRRQRISFFVHDLLSRHLWLVYRRLTGEMNSNVLC